MKIERREKEKATILSLTGDLVYEGIDELENQFKLSCDDAHHVILDFARTRYLSAKALGIMAFYVKHFRDRQKGLKLINVNENIKKLLVITGLLKLIEIFDDEDAALASLGPQVGKLEKMLLWAKKDFI
ncbi:MAG TPA: STAS domain-containing protein [Candidatus Wunengus sp. YC63]|uniref:STAS domain-containing protein n=1 Tax=unclassified Candidatus Wunengus TaxID=3367695 RepID=UPI001E09FD0D|nr:STAS domain-containing protein [Planctomycetota bacterium]